MSKSESYYYVDPESKRTVGPISFSMLQRMRESGIVNDDTEVLGEEDGEWRRFGDLRSDAPFLSIDSTISTSDRLTSHSENDQSARSISTREYTVTRSLPEKQSNNKTLSQIFVGFLIMSVVVTVVTYISKRDNSPNEVQTPDSRTSIVQSEVSVTVNPDDFIGTYEGNRWEYTSLVNIHGKNDSTNVQPGYWVFVLSKGGQGRLFVFDLWGKRSARPFTYTVSRQSEVTHITITTISDYGNKESVNWTYSIVVISKKTICYFEDGGPPIYLSKSEVVSYSFPVSSRTADTTQSRVSKEYENLSRNKIIPRRVMVGGVYEGNSDSSVVIIPKTEGDDGDGESIDGTVVRYPPLHWRFVLDDDGTGSVYMTDPSTKASVHSRLQYVIRHFDGRIIVHVVRVGGNESHDLTDDISGIRVVFMEDNVVEAFGLRIGSFGIPLTVSPRRFQNN